MKKVEDIFCLNSGQYTIQCQMSMLNGKKYYNWKKLSMLSYCLRFQIFIKLTSLQLGHLFTKGG